MSSNPSLSEEFPGGDGDRSIDDTGGANARQKNQLTPQQLRDQRMSRLGGGGGTSSDRTRGKPQLKDPPPSSSSSELSTGSTAAASTSTSTAKSTTSSVVDKGLMKPPPTYTTTTFLDNSSSSSSKSTDTGSTKPLSTSENSQATPSPSPDILGNPIEGNRDIFQDNESNNESDAIEAASSNNSTNAALRVASLAEKEDEDLQAALALSMGLPVPPSKFVIGSAISNSNFDTIEPLQAFDIDTGEELTEPMTTGIDNDVLATAAMVVATSPGLLMNTPASTAPSMPMCMEEDYDTDVVMESDGDRKPAAVVVGAKPQTSPSQSQSQPASPSRILRSNPQHFSGRVRTWYETASSYNVLDFHDCMWDKGVTTENDQKRWLAQGIQFKDERNNSNDIKKNNSSSPSRAGTDTSSLLATIISGPGVWCLTQQHGGPCGVLASIQAELLGILLFGPRTVHPLSMISIDFPDDLSTEFTKAAPDMSKQKMRQVLALSMGMILARSSLMPPASLQDDNTAESDRNSSDDDEDSQSVTLPRSGSTVQLILPKNELWNTTTCLEWQHLEPWNCSGDGGGVSEHFLSYTISLKKHSSGRVGGGNTTVKRQKRGSIGKEELEDIDHTCKELAHATAQFLLETNSLNWFQRPGGVLLMVMSIAASRGISKTQGDMDDLTSKLTSNYGHCSQELINLLLTGQAVSNVFDHTLRPSGELLCRGIRSQPAIGYLTQLEAMRYVEVGGFYKSPRFPIWVIGSTSHFSILFGDASALKESASDALLEKVRRAFKRMDGGAEEKGFIQTGQLGDFLKSLELKSISDHEVQTLAAFMDRYGAGIILWEDLWKRTSRLLTGASLESILNGTDEPDVVTSNKSNAASAMSESPNTNTGAPLSDEELARKLQAEWNDEDDVMMGPSLVNVFDSGSAARSITTNQGTVAPTETFGHTFQLYHYNGLRGGNFKAFRVTRLSADEAIGASISLGSSNQASHDAGGFGGELDAVLRTKWPSCKIDWLNGSPPSIN